MAGIWDLLTGGGFSYFTDPATIRPRPSLRKAATGGLANFLDIFETAYRRQKYPGISETMARELLPAVENVTPLGIGTAAQDTADALKQGDWLGTSLAALGMVPGAGRGAKGAMTAGNDLKELASRSVTIYDPPAKPARAFELDYASGAKADPTGRLLEDIDGRPLTAPIVVGRRVVGGEDVPLPPSQYDAVAEATIGARPEAVEAKALPRRSVGTYVEGYSPTGDPERDIYFLNTLPPEKAQKVVAHEMGHMFDSLAREWKSDPKANIPKAARSELNFVYNDLNNPDLNMARQRGLDVERNSRKLYKGYKPEHLGYKSGPEADAELAAEFGRAYLGDPNYVKTVAPLGAKWWRERVNPHPRFKDIIQFNSLAAALAPAGLMGYLAERDKQ
jgi:hypothetical protein